MSCDSGVLRHVDELYVMYVMLEVDLFFIWLLVSFLGDKSICDSYLLNLLTD